MAIYTWPHAHLAHALRNDLLNATDAGTRVTTGLPRQRTHPLATVQTAGLGPLGTDHAIQADEVRVQQDSWADTKRGAEKLAAQVFRRWDKRFGGLQDVTLRVQDEEHAGDYYDTNIERIGRSGGGDGWFDEFEKKWRVTTFYNVKINF